jgi:hypothetical protein
MVYGVGVAIPNTQMTNSSGLPRTTRAALSGIMWKMTNDTRRDVMETIWWRLSSAIGAFSLT